MLYNNVIITPLQNLAKHNPDYIVLQNNKKTTGAGFLYNKSLITASNLYEKGLRESDVVLIAMLPDEEFLIVFYALLILRVKIAIIDNEMGRDNYESKMKQLAPKWIFADNKLLLINKYQVLYKIANKFKENLPKLYFTKNINIIGTGNAIPFFKQQNQLKDFLFDEKKVQLLRDNNIDYENLIIYTSGTLSEPKGVVHTNKSLQSSLFNMGSIFFGDKNIVLATYLPHFILLGIACNFFVKIMNPLMDAKKKLAWFGAENITAFFGAPYDFLPLITYCEINNTKFPITLNHLIVGSAPVHKQFLTRLIAVLPNTTKITCTYGMTEHLVTALADGREKVYYQGQGDLLGTIVDNINLQIADDGEILVQSTQLFKRYLHQTKGNTIHASGDLGYIDTDGKLVLTGRKKDMIIRRNFNIYPALYEDTIRKIPGISEAVMVGIYDAEKFDETVFLIVETEVEKISEIEKKLKTGIYSIDTEALPDKIIKMEIPRLGRHQKIDKTKIREIIKSNYL